MRHEKPENFTWARFTGRGTVAVSTETELRLRAWCDIFSFEEEKAKALRRPHSK